MPLETVHRAIGSAKLDCAKAVQESDCWSKFPEDAGVYKPAKDDVPHGMSLKDSAWLNPQQQQYGNCAVQSAQLLIRWGTERADKVCDRGYTEEEMEVIANCPKQSGYTREGGTSSAGIRTTLENSGLIVCEHKQTPENIRKALDAGYPIETTHEVKELWGEQEGGHAVATVGYIADKDGNLKAYLVHDTGRGCLYYCPAERYEKSLHEDTFKIVIGKKRNCRDKVTGKPVPECPADCCLRRYRARMQKPVPEEALKTRLARDEELKKELAEHLKKRNEASQRHSQAILWAKMWVFDPQTRANWEAVAKVAEEEYKREEAEAVSIAERLEYGVTPMGPEDYGADADRQACSCADCECEDYYPNGPCPLGS